MILLFTYQYFHHIHCHSASIAMDYTTSSDKCWFGWHSWYRNTQNILCYSCKNHILSTTTFSPIQNIKIYCLIPLKNSLFHTDIIINHLTFGYRIGYGSDIAFNISLSAPNLRIRIRILTDVKNDMCIQVGSRFGCRYPQIICIWWHHYVLDMLSEANMLGYRLVDLSMDSKSKPLPDKGELLDNLGR